MNSSITGFDICYMRDTHYIIFCHPKKQLFHELANVYKEYQLNFDIFEGYSTS